MSDQKKLPDEVLRKYAWDYFALHAGQRMAGFQFFVTLSTALVGGYILLLRNTGGSKWMAALGFLMAFISFVFWRLDLRVRRLVKNAENALKFLDSRPGLPDYEGSLHPLALFARDDALVDPRRMKLPFLGHFSYSRCFEYLFFGFGVLGFAAGLASLCFFP